MLQAFQQIAEILLGKYLGPKVLVPGVEDGFRHSQVFGPPLGKNEQLRNGCHILELDFLGKVGKELVLHPLVLQKTQGLFRNVHLAHFHHLLHRVEQVLFGVAAQGQVAGFLFQLVGDIGQTFQ